MVKKPVAPPVVEKPVAPPKIVPAPKEPLPGPSSVLSMESRRARSKTAGCVLTYVELVEGPGAVHFPEKLDFRFEIPPEYP